MIPDLTLALTTTYTGPIPHLPFLKDLQEDWRNAQRRGVKLSDEALRRIVDEDFPGIVCPEAEYLPAHKIPDIGTSRAIRMVAESGNAYVLTLPIPGHIDFALYLEGKEEPPRQEVLQLMDAAHLMLHAGIGAL